MAVKTTSRIRANKPNILLACLATADFMVGVIVQPLFIALLITIVQDETTSGACALQVAVRLMTNVVCVNSLIHLALISVERYLAMKHAYAYSTGLVTEARLLVASALAWFLSLILFIPFFLNEQTVFLSINKTYGCLSLAMIVFCHITVYREVRRHEKALAALQVTEEARQKFLKDKKAFNLTVIIVSALFLCFIPIIVVKTFILNYGSKMSIKTEYVSSLFATSILLLNSLLNPLVYSVRMRQFRVAFIELTCRTANITEAEEIETRVFGSRNAVEPVVNLEAGQQHEGVQQNEEEADANDTNNDNNDVLPQHENPIEKLNYNLIKKPVQRRHSI